jgi:hypothetical protein
VGDGARVRGAGGVDAFDGEFAGEHSGSWVVISG